jgi:hypothetical protein
VELHSLKAQVGESTDALVEAAMEENEDEESGCLKGVLDLKGFGFIYDDEVEKLLKKVRTRGGVRLWVSLWTLHHITPPHPLPPPHTTPKQRRTATASARTG